MFVQKMFKQILEHINRRVHSEALRTLEPDSLGMPPLLPIVPSLPTISSAVTTNAAEGSWPASTKQTRRNKKKKTEALIEAKIDDETESDEEGETYDLCEDMDIKSLSTEALTGMQQEATRIRSRIREDQKSSYQELLLRLDESVLEHICRYCLWWHDDGKGHTGIYITLGGGPIFATSSKQKLVCLSSTEAKLVGLTDGSKYVIS